MSYGYSNIEEEEDDVIIIPKYSSLIEIEDYEDENEPESDPQPWDQSNSYYNL